MTRRPPIFITMLVLFLGALLPAAEPADPEAAMPQVVKRAEINPEVPVFVPVHPRIATTITFPKPIGEPVGTGFIDSETLQKAASEGKTVGGRGEYAITYVPGENSFSVQPLPKSDLLNLNVPYEGVTIVLYFYVVEKPLAAVASLTFVDGVTKVAGTARRSEERVDKAEPAGGARGIQRVLTTPPNAFKVASPARLEGLLRKLKLVHAARAGAELEDVASALKLKVAVSVAEDSSGGVIAQPFNDAGLYQLILLRAVRDPSLDAVGFIVIFRNTSKDDLVFDLSTLSARCGAALYTAQVVDAPASLKPGEVLPGYFIVVGSADGRPGYLLPNNDWRLSVALISPESTAAKSLQLPAKGSP